MGVVRHEILLVVGFGGVRPDEPIGEILVQGDCVVRVRERELKSLTGRNGVKSQEERNNEPDGDVRPRREGNQVASSEKKVERATDTEKEREDDETLLGQSDRRTMSVGVFRKLRWVSCRNRVGKLPPVGLCEREARYRGLPNVEDVLNHVVGLGVWVGVLGTLGAPSRLRWGEERWIPGRLVGAPRDPTNWCV